MRNLRTAACGIATAGTIIFSSTVQADVVASDWITTGAPGGLEFEYRITDMPDFDQRRATGGFGVVGLPANGGMYCVPTAAINLMAYLTNHGHELISSGPSDWQSNGMYNPITLNIAAMGLYMGTHPQDGTSGQGGLDGYTAWMADHEDVPVVFQKYASSGYYAPTFDEMIATALSTGGVVSFVYGRYPVTQHSGNSITVGSRSGGHAVTLTAGRRDEGGGIISYRDPADDSKNLITQSPFVSRIKLVVDRDITFFSDSLGQNVTKVMSQLGGEVVVGENIRLIDSFYVMYPQSMMSIHPDALQLYMPEPILGCDIEPLQEVSISPFVTLLDAAFDADHLHVLTLTQSVFAGQLPQLSRRNRLTGEVVNIMSIAGATDLAVGGNRQVYIGGGNSLRRLDLSRPAGQQVLATVNVGFTISDVFFNEETNQVAMLSIPGRRIIRYPENFSGLTPGMVGIIPAAVPLSGDGSVSVNPLNGKHWIQSAASDSLFGLTIADTGIAVQTLTLPAIDSPTCIDFDDRGHMFVVDHGEVLELAELPPGPTAGGWQLVPNSKFNGFTPGPGGEIRIARSRTNEHPVEHASPGWNTNIHPDDLEIDPIEVLCPADLNFDLQINGIDLGILLSQWATDGSADLNNDNVVNGIDLGILLAAWGICD